MKLFKKVKNKMSTSKQRMKASELLWDIGEMVGIKETTYYEVNLLPKLKGNSYDYETYIKLLEEVKKQLKDGARSRIEPKTIVATARIKVLI